MSYLSASTMNLHKKSLELNIFSLESERQKYFSENLFTQVSRSLDKGNFRI